MDRKDKKLYTSKDISELINLDHELEKKKKIRSFRQLNKYAKQGQILFTGSSLMEQFPVCELYSSLCPGSKKILYNRGVGGFTSDEFINDIDTVMLDIEPSKIFINVGKNDMNSDSDTNGEDAITHIISNYENILKAADEHLSDPEIYIMAYYPVNTNVINMLKDRDLYEKFKTRSNEKISEANVQLKKFADTHDCFFIDANSGLTDSKGELRPEFTIDGVHMYPDAYRIVFENIVKYI